MKAEKRGFTRGFVYAIAQLIRLEPTSVEEMWRESGFTVEDLSICDDYDANEVRLYFSRNGLDSF